MQPVSGNKINNQMIVHMHLHMNQTLAMVRNESRHGAAPAPAALAAETPRDFARGHSCARWS